MQTRRLPTAQSRMSFRLPCYGSIAGLGSGNQFRWGSDKPAWAASLIAIGSNFRASTSVSRARIADCIFPHALDLGFAAMRVDSSASKAHVFSLQVAATDRHISQNAKSSANRTIQPPIATRIPGVASDTVEAPKLNETPVSEPSSSPNQMQAIGKITATEVRMKKLGS